MNKTELIDAIAAKTGLSKADSSRALAAFTETVAETLKAGDKVGITGFGTFKASQRAARVSKNPRTGAPVQVPASVAPKFSAGSELKASLN
jgi:DNA-binding protein HU-beta